MQSQSFTLENIKNHCFLSDTDLETGLRLYSYPNCTNEDTDFLKNCRGLVFHGEDLVVKSFPYTDEYSVKDEKLNEIFLNLNWKFYKSYEGCLIRVFNFADKWFVATHKKLNAFNSKWSCRKSFGELFFEALEKEEKINESFRTAMKDNKFYDILNKNKQYMFLLRNNSENRIVCKEADERDSSIFHVGTFCEGKLSMTENIGLRYPESYTFTSLEDILNFVKETDINESQGLICYGDESTGFKQIKILSERYLELFKIRGNEPSLKFRYLQVRNVPFLVENLLSLYPNMKESFKEYESIISTIADNIYTAYYNRFIRKEFTTVSKDEFKILKECHDFFLQDRDKNKVNFGVVYKILNNQSPIFLNRLIKRIKFAF